MVRKDSRSPRKSSPFLVASALSSAVFTDAIENTTTAVSTGAASSLSPSFMGAFRSWRGEERGLLGEAAADGHVVETFAVRALRLDLLADRVGELVVLP